MNYLEQKIRTCRIRLMEVLLLNFTDWFCTVVITKFDGFFEVNPIMNLLLDNPVLCFILKCVVPAAFILYIFFLLPIGGEKTLMYVGVMSISIFIFYFLINIVHVINFFILFLAK